MSQAERLLKQLGEASPGKVMSQRLEDYWEDFAQVSADLHYAVGDMAHALVFGDESGQAAQEYHRALGEVRQALDRLEGFVDKPGVPNV